MKVLVTGFEPFGGFHFNPSEAILRLVPKWLESSEGATLRTCVLRASYRAAGSHIRKLIERFQPDRLLCFGLAADRPTVRLERVALNLNDSAMADDRGRIRRGRSIVPGGPAAYFSTAPIDRLNQVLAAKGVNVEISNYAAAFVCNHAYYCALDSIATAGLTCQCLLVHLPLSVRPRQPNRPIHVLGWCDLERIVKQVVLEFVGADSGALRSVL